MDGERRRPQSSATPPLGNTSHGWVPTQISYTSESMGNSRDEECYTRPIAPAPPPTAEVRKVLMGFRVGDIGARVYLRTNLNTSSANAPTSMTSLVRCLISWHNL